MKIASKYQVFSSIIVGGFTGLHWGSVLAFSAILVPHLTKDFYNLTSEEIDFTNTTSEVLDFTNSTSEVPDFTNTFTLSERSWIASVSLFGQLVSALISGFVSNSIGRKNCLLLFNIPLLVGWLMLIFHQGNFYVCLFARILQGFGVIPSIGQIYLMEVLDTKHRETYGSILALSISIGITLVYLLGALTNSWITVAWIFIALVIIQCFCLLFVPKSPQWLVSQDRQEEAYEALITLRGTAKPTANTEIIDELKLLRNASEVDCECFICQDKKWQIIKIWKELQQPRSYKPLWLLIFLFTLQQLSGPHAVVAYAVNIFSGIIVDKRAANFTAISVGAIKILGSVLAIGFLKKKVSKRLQMTCSAIGMFIAMATFAIVEYIKQYHTLEKTVGTTFQVISSFIYILLHSIGFQVIAMILLGELCPVKLKSLTSGIVISIESILAFGVVKIFPIALVSVGTTATAVFFAVISIIAAGFSFRFIPETCGKNVEELSFLYRRKAMVMDPTELISMTMDLPRSRKMTVEEYDDNYLSYVTIGDLERSDL